MFERKERLYVDPKTGKASWITTKEGLIKPRKSKGSFSQAVDRELKKQKQIKKQASRKKWAKRKKTYKKVAKDVNAVLDWVEGKPPKKKKKKHNTRKKRYYVKNGVAYPVYNKKRR